MSSINNFHPFRQTITHEEGAPLGNASTPSSVENAASDDDSESGQFTLKTKLRLGVGALAAVSLLYVIEYTYSSVATTSYSSSKSSEGTSTEHDTNSLINALEDDEIGKEDRNVSNARGNAGFLATFFCKGGKKSSFCD